MFRTIVKPAYATVIGQHVYTEQPATENGEVQVAGGKVEGNPNSRTWISSFQSQ